jgi:hypothetical protein
LGVAFHLVLSLLLGCDVRPTEAIEERLQASQLAATVGKGDGLAIGKARPFVASLRNSGRSAVRIVDVKTKCGCTKAVLDRREIRPGEAASLTTTLSPQMRAGRFRYWVTLVCEDGSECSVPIEGEVVSLLPLEPRALTVRPNPVTHEPGTAEFTLVNHADREVEVRSVEVTPKAAELVVEPSSMRLSPGAVGRFHVVCRPIGIARQTFDLMLATSHDTERFVSLRCNVVPNPGVQVVPEHLHLGILSVERFNQSAPLASIRVVADEPSGWTIESISLPDYCAPARPISISPGVFTLSLSPRAGHTPPRDLSGTVRIALFHRGHNLRGIASVPVRGNLK